MLPDPPAASDRAAGFVEKFSVGVPPPVPVVPPLPPPEVPVPPLPVVPPPVVDDAQEDVKFIAEDIWFESVGFPTACK